MNKTWSIHTVDRYSPRKNEALTHTTAWMSLRVILPNTRSQSQWPISHEATDTRLAGKVICRDRKQPGGTGGAGAGLGAGRQWGEGGAGGGAAAWAGTRMGAGRHPGAGTSKLFLSVQFSAVKYIPIVVKQIVRTYSVCKSKPCTH